MQVIENWADIRGKIHNLSETGDFPDFITALIEVESIASVPGFANLFGQESGKTIRVNIPQATVQGISLKPGQRIACRIRKGGPQTAFAHPSQVSVETV